MNQSYTLKQAIEAASKEFLEANMQAIVERAVALMEEQAEVCSS